MTKVELYDFQFSTLNSDEIKWYAHKLAVLTDSKEIRTQNINTNCISDMDEITFTANTGKTKFLYNGYSCYFVHTHYQYIISQTKGTFNPGTMGHDIHIMAPNFKEAETVFKKFHLEAITAYDNRPSPEKTIIRTLNAEGGWQEKCRIHKRTMDTIYMDPIVKQKIINDIQMFLDSFKEYRKFSIPYGRNYLFYGVPGSGKTSLIRALAAHFNYNICTIPFDMELTNNALITGINLLSKKDFLVIEDVDAHFPGREPSKNHQITFSTFLNIIDGINRKDGIIAFLTANNIKELDPALLRPARMDYRLEFTFADKQAMKQMFAKFLPDQTQHFETLYSHIEGKRFNLALFQKFLFERKCENILAPEHLKNLHILITEHEQAEKNYYT